jgi:glycosyltransferase involved in cell wall biosynthesis
MHNDAKLPISLVVITMNEEENLRRCLAAADFCTEFVVVDSGSTDGTLVVAEQFGARVFHRTWNGYGEQKNFGCEQAAQPWILCIDADEVITEELQASIRTAFQSEPRTDGFDINRHGVYAGKVINHSGWYPQWRTFLYRKGAAVWGGMEPHVIVQFTGSGKSKLTGDLMHYTYRTIDEHLRKNISSARAAAHAMKSRGKLASALDLLARPVWAWFRCFVVQRGFLDGFHGLVIANGQATYTFLKYAYLRELHGSSK